MSFASVNPADGSKISSFKALTIVLKSRTAMQRAQLYRNGALFREYGQSNGGSLSSTGRTWTISGISVSDGVYRFVAKYWGADDTTAHEIAFTYTAVSASACGAPEWVRVDNDASNCYSTWLRWGEGTHGTNNEIVGYEVERAEIPYNVMTDTTGEQGKWKYLGATYDTAMRIDPPTSPGHKYVYRVRACGAAGLHSDWMESEDGFLRLLLTYTIDGIFTDPVLVPGETPVKAVHILELWNWHNATRRQLSMRPKGHSDIEAEGLAHWKEHIEELRLSIDSIFKYYIQWIEITDNTPRADVIQQIRELIPYVNDDYPHPYG